MAAAGIGSSPAQLLVAGPSNVSKGTVVQSFGPEHCINCMCHSTENLYNYKYTAMARVSDDFYPKDLPSQTWHIAAVACNSLFIGEITHPDWDMFHSVHPAAAMHAAARAIGGCSVYTSDAPGKHDFELLRKLTLPDGVVPVAQRPGRPTLDCLFSDPTRGRAAFKIWNENLAGGGVVAAFNLQGSAWDRKRRMYAFLEDVKDRAEDMKHEIQESLHEDGTAAPGAMGRSRKMARTHLGPADVWPHKMAGDDIVFTPSRTYAAWSHVGRTMYLLSHNDRLPVELEALKFEILTLMPVVELALPPPSQATGSPSPSSVAWAPIGLASMMNSGGALLAHEWGGDGGGGGSEVGQRGGEPWATATCMGPGEFVSYSSTRPQRIYVTVNGRGNGDEHIPGQRARDDAASAHEREPQFESAYTYDPASGFLSVKLPAVGQHDVTVVWR